MNGIIPRVVALTTMALATAGLAQPGRTLLSDVIVTAVDGGADVSLTFDCPVHYASHEPDARGRDLVLHFDATDLCEGYALAAAGTRRVRDGEPASLLEVEYEGEGRGAGLRLHFSREMEFDVRSQTDFRALVVAVRTPAPTPATASPPQTGRYAINLRSSNHPFAQADLDGLNGRGTYSAYQVRSEIQGRTWYRLRVGFFATESEARQAADVLRADYPGLWIGFAADGEMEAARTDPLHASAGGGDVTPASPGHATGAEPAASALAPASAAAAASPEKRAELLEEGRRALAAGELQQATQIFTKIVQQPDDEYAEAAQELLGVARERNGQAAHAKAAYEQYLERYPDAEGAARVRQRLAALTASTGENRASTVSTPPAASTAAGNPWNVDTSLWQYYRRMTAQVNDDPSLLTQSALLSNVDLNLVRAGERVDLESRLALGYWYDFMGADGPGSESTISHLYVEADGHEGNWRFRMGRQTRGGAGVLGRFDGALFSYQPWDRIRLNVASGYPVYSTRDAFDSTRVFEGISIDIDDVATAWDLSAFYNQQRAGGILDRQAIGTEARYFDDHRSLYALVDYDISYSTLNNVYLVGNWRTPGQLTMNATINRAHSPYLTTSNALVGQPLTSIDELIVLETEEQIRQLALDRTAMSDTWSLGLSRPVLQRLQVDVDVTSTSYSETVASGGVEAFPASDYRYYSISLLGQSLLKEGDMGILSLRFGDTTSYQVTSLSLDARYPVRNLRLNPRLRVDRRTRLEDGSTEWIYTPLLRLQLQWQRRYYLEFEGGLYLSSRDIAGTSNDYQTGFFNIGYRYVF